MNLGDVLYVLPDEAHEHFKRLDRGSYEVPKQIGNIVAMIATRNVL